MDTNYTPKVGDRVRRAGFHHDQWFDVTAVGLVCFLGTESDGFESAEPIGADWVRVETPTPLPECWVNVTTTGLGNDWPTRAETDEVAGRNTVAVLHVWTDADGVDHAEIERVTP